MQIVRTLKTSLLSRQHGTPFVAIKRILPPGLPLYTALRDFLCVCHKHGLRSFHLLPFEGLS